MPGLTGRVAQRRRAGVLRQGWSHLLDDYPTALAWACEGRLVMTGDSSGALTAVDAARSDIVWSVADAHEPGPVHLAVGGPSFVVSVGADGVVAARDADKGVLRWRHELGAAWLDTISVSPDGSRIATAAGRYTHHWSADGGDAWTSFEHPSTVAAVAWTPAGELVTASFGAVCIFGDDPEPKARFEWQDSLVSLVLSPDGEVVACGSQDNTVHFWRTSTGTDAAMYGYPAKPSALAFDDGSRLLATGGGEDVTVWVFGDGGPEGTTPGVLDAHSGTVTSLAFAPRSTTLASGGRDGGVLVWRLGPDGNGEAVGFHVCDGRIEAVAWRPDGRSLAAIDASGHLTTWRTGS